MAFDLPAAEQLIQKLKVESNPTELKQMQARIKATKSTRAQEYYQKAKAIAENLFLSDQQLKDSIQNFRLAIQEDPQYAQAYVGLSERLSLRGRSKHSLYSQEPEDLSHALQYADTAIELLPELDSAYRAKAKALQQYPKKRRTV